MKFKVNDYVKVTEYPQVEKLKIVKVLPDDTYGTRYLAKPSNIIIYGEYHQDELEAWTAAPVETPGIFMS